MMKTTLSVVQSAPLALQSFDDTSAAQRPVFKSTLALRENAPLPPCTTSSSGGALVGARDAGRVFALVSAPDDDVRFDVGVAALDDAFDAPPPQRPTGVPADATFSSKWNVWTIGERRGEAHVGVWRSWHATFGHRSHDSHYDNDGELTHVTRYHPDGRVAHEVPHREGVIHGVVRSFRATSPTPDPYFAHLPALVVCSETCCVFGITVGLSRLLDANGREVSATGQRKPDAVPEPSANGIVQLFHLDGRRWLDIRLIDSVPSGLQLYGDNDELVLEEEWRDQTLAAITSTRTAPPMTLSLNARRRVATVSSAGGAMVKLAAATKTSSPSAAWFRERFGQIFLPWLSAPGVSLSFKGVDIAGPVTGSTQGPIAASALLVDGGGSTIVVIESGAAAGAVVLLDHEDEPGSLEELDEIVRGKRWREFQSDDLVEKPSLLDGKIANSPVDLLRGITVTSSNATLIAPYL